MTHPSGDLIGRQMLLARLSDHLVEVREGRGRILALRGRRQVGKSTAVTSFVEAADVPYVYATGIKGAPTHAQLSAVGEAALSSRRPLAEAASLFAAPPVTWRDLLGRLTVAAGRGPAIVVLDEFPWMVQADATLEGELQAQWDRALEKLPVLLILIGSDVAMMERLGEHDRPLFGRTQPIVVPALNPSEVAEALPGRPAIDVVDAYLVTGGYPRLVRAVGRAPSTTSYVRRALQDEFSALVSTAGLTLDAEFPDREAAYRVLAAVGGSEVARPGFNDIVSAITDPVERDAGKTAVTRALRLLTDAKALVRRDVPAGAPPTSRLARYRITDPYLKFWFRFVEHQVDNISRGRPDISIARFDAGWSSWRGRAVEPVLHEALTRLGASDPRLAEVEQVAAWWTRDNSVEVDAVASSRAGVVALGTIKWRDRGGVTPGEVATLAHQRGVVPGAGAARLLAISPHQSPGCGADDTFTASDVLQAWTPS